MNGALTQPLERRLELVREVVLASPDPVRNPLDIDFRGFDGAELEQAWARLAAQAREGRGERALILYLHVPFCAKLCSYCLLASVRAPGRDVREAYVRALVVQIERMAEVVRGLPINTLHVGGGTPTLLSAEQLDTILGAVMRSFDRTPDFVAGVEAYPSTATPTKLAVLARHGIGRISLGVESLTPRVLQNVQRSDQTLERVQRTIDDARAAGLEQINVDMLAGLPGETVESFEEGMRLAAALDVDSMSVNRYLAENSPLASFGYAPVEREHRLTDEMLIRADAVLHELRPPTRPRRRLSQAGFGTQYVWDPRGEARSYFQQDMIGPRSTLALGYGGMGHLHGGGYTTSAGTVEDYIAAMEAGEAAPVLVSPTRRRFEMAFHFADRACRGMAEDEEFRAWFGGSPDAAYGAELRFLAEQGLLARGAGGWTKPPSRDFDVVHLLAFLLHDVAALEQRQARLSAGHLDAGEPAPSRPASTVTLAVTDAGARSVARIEALRGTGLERLVLQLEGRLGSRAKAEEAHRLWRAAAQLGVPVEVEREEDRVMDQYAALEEELPPSVLWCRIAMNAAYATRRHRDPGLVRL